MGPSSRQAVLLIHGIGEQRPMSTLREFVTAVVGSDFKSKPHDLSKLLELRRLVYNSKPDDWSGMETCFFEYYWAYRFRDTTWRNVFDWAWLLLWNRPKNIPGRLKPIYWLCWGSMIVMIAVLSVLALRLWRADIMIGPAVERIISLLPTVLALLATLFSCFLLYWVGDAARYLNSAPANIAERQAIRADGLELLHRLHDATDVDGKPKYDRIIVVGHSLGSVIGYDILKFYWAEVHNNATMRIQTSSTSGESLRFLTAKGRELAPPTGADKRTKQRKRGRTNEPRIAYRHAQSELMEKLSPPCWRISDFVTLGSPLTYAAFLLAKDEMDLTNRQKDRELPTCPPQQEKDGYTFPYEDPQCGSTGEEVLHHAALFTLTRWTNLYFPGDLIGGEVACHFGDGVAEIECRFCEGDRWPWPLKRLNRSRQFWSHIRYWREKLLPTSLNELKDIIRAHPSATQAAGPQQPGQGATRA